MNKQKVPATIIRQALMQIREAQEKDIEAWARLRLKLWPNSDDGHIGELQEYFNKESIDIVQAYVLENVQGELLGFMELNIRNFSEGSRSPKVPYVEAWYIDASVRGLGYGKRFMQLAENWAREQGYSELASDTEITNEKSIAIHKKLGFEETERVVCFLKKL